VPKRLKPEHFVRDPGARVTALPDFVSWERAEQVQWPEACAEAVKEFTRVVHAAPEPAPPQVVRASVFSPEQARDYPHWQSRFRAGQLFARPQAWYEVFRRERVPMSAKLERWVSNRAYGVYIDLDEQAPQPGPNQLTPEELDFAYKDCVQKWLESGAISPITLSEKHKRARVCNLIVAYRMGRMERACWSGACVNEGVEDASFRMEQLQDVLQLCEPGDWAFSLDFEKGFHQIALDQTSDFLLFRAGATVYRWNVLPMGLKTAPKHFSQIVKQTLKIFRQRGIRCCFYIDDLIFFAKSREDACNMRRFVLGILYELGWRVSLKKSLLNPGQLLQHLGFDLCTANRTLWILPHKVQRIRSLSHDMLKHLGSTTGKQLSVLLGVLRSNSIACGIVSVLSVGLAKAMSSLPILGSVQPVTQTGKHKGQRQREFQLRDYSECVRFSDLAVAELRFWSQCAWRVRGSRFGRPVELAVFTDACPTGFGSVLCSVEYQCSRSQPVFNVRELTAGNWEKRCDANSTAFELLTILLSVKQHEQSLAGKRVHVATDNVGAAFICNKGSKSNPRLQYWALQLAALCHASDVQLSTAYVAGDGIIISGADALSRGADVYACVLSAPVFRRIWDRFGPLDVDAWASVGARQCDPVSGVLLPCVSPFDCSNRVGVDAMASFNRSLRLYAFPPVPMLHRYIAAVIEQQQPVVLVVPAWPTQPWWPRLRASAPSSRWLWLGRACDIFDVEGVPHPFGEAFDAEQACTHEFWAVALFC
jgi:Reverse transcriptase (RNA-dependent DNA polymerase)/RNase H-like domain found in reverse transcriptase